MLVAQDHHVPNLLSLGSSEPATRDWWVTGIDFANIELSFGPSWQYAELELRGRLDRVSVKEDHLRRFSKNPPTL